MTPPDVAPDAEIHVLPMRRRHLRGVLRIEQAVYPRPWSLGLFMSELRYQDTRRYFVARDDIQVVGYGGLMLIGDEGHITTVAVDPQRRREAIGTRLMLVLARTAVDEGVVNLTLEVRVSNTAAQDLYRRFGFAPAGVRKNYYADVREDALIMWAHDVNTADHARRLAAIEADLPTATVLEGIS